MTENCLDYSSVFSFVYIKREAADLPYRTFSPTAQIINRTDPHFARLFVPHSELRD